MTLRTGTFARALRSQAMVSSTCLLLLAVGCDSEAESLMTFSIDPPGFSPEGFDGLRIELRTSDGRVTLIGADFTERFGAGLAASEDLPVPNSGEAVVSMVFTDQGEVLAEGAVSFQLREATKWGVRLFRSSTDPSNFCLGCEGVGNFPIKPEHQREPHDAVWIAWGGLKEGEVVGAPFCHKETADENRFVEDRIETGRACALETDLRV
jgi:hypothetical protein